MIKVSIFTAALICCASTAPAQTVKEIWPNPGWGTGSTPAPTYGSLGVSGTPPTQTPLQKARTIFQTALSNYNSSKVRTKAHRDYVLGLRSKYAAEYRRENTPPSEYDRPYTGVLTLERVADPAAVLALCPDLGPDPVGCAKVPKDLSYCKVYIVSDAYINRRSPEVRKLFGQSYESILRHELAHCNGWPSDHPH